MAVLNQFLECSFVVVDVYGRVTNTIVKPVSPLSSAPTDDTSFHGSK